MPMAEPVSHEATVRKVDYNRYLAAVFAPARSREDLFALYAFNYEVAKTAETVREPIAGHIRLQWWREAIEESYAGCVRAHPVAVSLERLITRNRLPRSLFDEIIDARESDIEEAPFADMASLESYSDTTSGNLMRIAARLLGAGESLDDAARNAGIAYALTGLLRALPYHAARRHSDLPLDLLRRLDLSPEEVFSGEAAGKMSAIIEALAQQALARLGSARRDVPRRFLPALLPATLVPGYLHIMTRPGFDPYRHAAEMAVHRRQIAMVRAILRGRI